MTLAAGTKLGPYEIVAPLGAGGMGEVYRARDTKLNREVALKVLPAAMANDAERMARFEREAQVLASLNHPNIATIHGLEESGKTRALVMELVEGQTLAERLARRLVGPGLAPALTDDATRPPQGAALQFDEALGVAKQIADALEFAHERGIIHRDLKPANIKITPDGAVKVLDFGLAKAFVAEDSSSGISNSPTISIAATQAGMILGTAAYMSPEQAKGKKVDRRADIWAFGCVCYEMLTGKKIFEGETTSDVLAAVIRADPDWNVLPADTPPSIRHLLVRCLQKDPKQRLRDIGDARITIEETLSGEGVGAGRVPALVQAGTETIGGGRPQGSRLRRALPWALATVFLIVALAVGNLLRQAERPGARMQFEIPVQAEVGNLALSADGRMLALVERDEVTGQNMLYFERLGSPNATRLNGTEGVSYPCWSPDDAYLAFFANGKLKRVSISGGAPQILATASFGRGASWGRRGVIIYAPDASGPLWRVNADGTGAVPLTNQLYLSSENSHRWPVFLPDGTHFLFWAGSFGENRGEGHNGIFLSSLDSKEKKLIISALSNPGYANGHLYYVDEGKRAIAVPFNPSSGSHSGEPMVVSDQVSYQPSVYWGAFTVGGKDVVVYNTSTAAVHSALTLYDRTGKETGRIGETGVTANPSISPDGRHATVDIADLKGASVDVWIEDLDRNTSSRFTFANAEDVTGVWSRDGLRIAYRSISNGNSALEIKSAAGLESQNQVYQAIGGDDILPNSWGLDDKSILCSFQPAAGGSDLVNLDVATGKVTPFVATKASETNGMISPDGKWAAYASNETGDWEIYVTTYPGAQGKWQVSRNGSTEPRWQGDGKELFFIDSKGMLIDVPVSTAGTFSAAAPATLFQIHGRAPISSTDLFTYDVTRDGKRFLVNRYVKPDHIQPLTVVLNATAKGQ
ncbi:MAG TPA: protein kinase [Terriglobia bacterium]|nr:protein kinase [Terriglobia bacterium]